MSGSSRQHNIDNSGLAKFGKYPSLLSLKAAQLTTKDIVPIVAFDGQTIGTGGCGIQTKAIIEDLAKLA